MNRALMTDKEVLKTKEAVATTTQASVATVAVAINVDHGAAANIIDRLKAKQDHQAARNRNIEKKRKAATITSIVQETKKATSGMLVGRGDHRLGVAVLEQVRNHAVAKAAKEQMTMDKKRQVQQKLFDKVAVVRNKEQATWTMADYRTMNLYKKTKSDTKLPNKLEDLVAQWELRKDRPSPVKLSPVTSIMPALIGQGDNSITMNGNNDNEDDEDEESVHETGII